MRADNKLIHDFYLVQVKSPRKIHKPWAYYDVVQKLPAAEAYQPLSESECPIVTAKAK